MLLIFISVCGSKSYCQSMSESRSSGQLKQKNFEYSFKLFESTDKTWGYDILKNNKLFIHQTTIPGLPGNSGIEKKSDAEKVARLVIEKLKIVERVKLG